MSERPKERASKAREGQPSAGSNPAATASLTRPKRRPRRNLGAGAFGGLKCGLNLVAIGASLLDHSRPSRRLARSLWIGEEPDALLPG